jgi:uncharacterized protein (TIGR03437 family)
MYIFRISLLTIVLFAFAPLATAQGGGRVVDLISGNGIAGSAVQCASPLQPSQSGPKCVYLGDSQSDANGYFTCQCRAVIADPQCSQFPISCGPSSFTKPDYQFALSTFVLNGATVYVGTNLPQAVTVRAASYTRDLVTAGMIVATFGEGLATTTVSAPASPLPVLPEALAGHRILVLDSQGVEKPAPLFFVSPTQINFVIPEGLAEGGIAIRVMRENQPTHVSFARLIKVQPDVFSADASGQGLATAVILRIKADGSRSFESIAQFDSVQNRFIALPIEVRDETQQVILVLFGTGWRNRQLLDDVTVKIGGQVIPLIYAGSQNTLAGLDQINARLPNTLAGRGLVDLVVTVGTQASNKVLLHLK